jgi:hypothetical protein
MDFTVKKYEQLLRAVKTSGYAIQNMASLMKDPLPQVIVFRHDVDERPENALPLARAEYRLGIRATYYFRIVKISNNSDVIREIAGLGHEIGYHYEDYSSCNGNHEKAIKRFQKNLAYFRQFYPVITVCMHGSSMSGFDNRDLWKQYSLEDFGLIGEPYLSIDYSGLLYLTDTARTWNGSRYNIRDSVNSRFREKGVCKTDDIIRRLRANDLPDKIILQSHTLWTDNLAEWVWLEMREVVRNRLKIVLRRSPELKNMAYKMIQKYSNK